MSSGGAARIFLSYASEDHRVADRIYTELTRRGLSVWLDRDYVNLGDDFANSIAHALERARCGLLLVSPDSLRKAWPKREFAALMRRGVQILPIYHRITSAEVARVDPELAKLSAISTKEGLDRIVDRVLRAL